MNPLRIPVTIVLVTLALSCGKEPPASGTTTVADTGATIAVTGTQPTETIDPATITLAPVAVSLSEFQIDLPESLKPGPTSFQILNKGTMSHSFRIEGNGIERMLGRDMSPGASSKLDMDLQPGTYRVYCPVGDHAEKRGMSRQITVQ